MAGITHSLFAPQNVAELLSLVGGVPANRVLLAPSPGTATEADLILMCETKRKLCELVDGTLVEKAMGAIESYLAVVLARYLGNFIAAHDLGILLGEAGMLRFSATRIYLPDISFISWQQDPMRAMQKQQVPNLHPDLAIEVLSPANTLSEMERKRSDYFEWGTQLVWQLEPKTKSMQVFTAVDTLTTVEADGVLGGGEVVPGFSLPLAKLFENTDRFIEAQN
jgi:Uma2 family endonuclease